MLKLKIGQRALLTFVAISMTPVLFLNTYWLQSQQGVMRKEAEEKQALITESAADRTNEFISRKISALILHAQTATILDGKSAAARAELENYIKQDSDIDSIVLASKTGDPVVKILSSDVKDPNEKSTIENYDISSAFKIVTFLGGKEFISPVTYINDKPHIQIAVPVVTFTGAQNNNNPTTSERGVIRDFDDINGALIIMVDLSSTWSEVFTKDEASTSLSYIVDDQRRLIGHPDANFSKSQTDISSTESVKYFYQESGSPLKDTIEVAGINGVPVLASASEVPLTNWIVISEVPLSVIDSPARQVASQVWLMNVAFALVAVGISLVFSRRITNPIKLLARDAKAIGSGKFDTHVAVRNEDEIGQLGNALNEMGAKLKTLVERIDSERNQLDVVLNSIDEGVFALDRNGNIRLTNTPALKMFGVTDAMVAGTSFSKLATFKQDLAQVVIDVHEIKFTDDNIAMFKDLQFADSSGKQRYCDIILARLSHVENDIETIVTVVDQTSNRELEAMKVDFVSLAAHELRTPLTAIRGYLELTLKDKDPELADKHRRFLLQASDSSQQLTSLINNLLNVSKIERNALKMSMDKLDWTMMVQNSVSNLQFSAEKAKLSLAYSGPETGIDVIGDSVALREVIDNLIANAIHYTSEKGSVTVTLRVEDNKIITSVHDTGIGIPEAAVQKLFTKFYRVHGGLATGSGGSGLGLYISKSIIESHDGTIWVESKEGVGSTFSFSIPAYDEERYQQYQTSPERKLLRRKHGWITKNTTR